MQEAFVEVRIKSTSSSVLAYPYFAQHLVVETDASSFSVGAFLAQNKEDMKIHPIQTQFVL